MICRNCLRRASALRPQSSISRSFSSSSRQFAPDTTASPRTGGTPAATSTGLAQPFSNPLTPSPAELALGASAKSKAKPAQIPVSSCPAGTPLKGLNFLKGRDDPVALSEEEYPEWLWRCLDVKVKEGDEQGGAGDEFSKSKKLRRKAAKHRAKMEAKLIASSGAEALAPKIPITQQSIDLPSNESGTISGALEAEAKREELRAAMRRERRAKIKENNFLKGM